VKLTYRPEIDGLRAIAVVAVILYHAQVDMFGHQFFKGGFIGVDIFFVISGYLITSIIIKELVTTGSFSFKHFYLRRIRRIIPALLFVMLISIPFSLAFLLPENILDLSKSTLYSLGFSSNFYFHYSGQQYGAENSILRPFLHTWSLSIEEQFYILFPIILLFTFKFFRKFLLLILILVFLISLGLADWGSKNHPSFNFYFLPTRCWELLAGSILAYIEIAKGKRSQNRVLNLILPFIGFLLILHSIFFFTLVPRKDEMLHPSIYTLTPIIGVCLIIWFSNKEEFITKILSTKLFVGIGLISYSLYLLHYPIFAFARVIGIYDKGICYLILIFLFLILISICSFYFIEQPFRNTKLSISKFLFFTITTFLIIFSFSILSVFKNGKLGSYHDERSKVFINNYLDNNELLKSSLNYIENFNIQEFVSKNKIKILIVGDSHSIDLFNAFTLNNDLFNQYEFKRYGISESAENSLKFGHSTTSESLLKFENSKVFIQSDIILISNYFNEDINFKVLRRFLDLFSTKKRIILTTNSNIYQSGNNFRHFTGLTLFDDFFLNKKDNTLSDNNLSTEDIYELNNYYYMNRDKNKIEYINDNLKKIANEYDIQILYKEDFQCEILNKICFGVTNQGMKIHYDYGHFTIEGAKFFGKKIFELSWLKIN
jgi:peptidoglycan/LPS O-acetylase OafA/YrhL